MQNQHKIQEILYTHFLNHLNSVTGLQAASHNTPFFVKMFRKNKIMFFDVEYIYGFVMLGGL